ncbi:MAG: uracil-DNA glycosylase [Planctomycetota bacterium]
MPPRKSPGWASLNKAIEACDRCPRLRQHCEQIALTKRKAYADHTYWGRPVPNFGGRRSALLIVGLAPGAHGANRTGRMFTGDRSGDWLYRALYRAGFATQAESTHRSDGLRLVNCAITAVCHCAPPDNKPTSQEIESCSEWLETTLALCRPRVIVALGQLAWRSIFREAKQHGRFDGAIPKFGHLAEYPFHGGPTLIGSYHPSQQNTFTKRLTEPMLDAVFTQATKRIDERAVP